MKNTQIDFNQIEAAQPDSAADLNIENESNRDSEYSVKEEEKEERDRSSLPDEKEDSMIKNP